MVHHLVVHHVSTDAMPRIEQEIMQRQFRNERHKAIVNIVYTGHWLTARHSKFLKQFHLTEQQFNILRILQGQYPKPASITLLRERMLDKMSDVSRLVERLRKLDFVERRTSRLDRRAVEVSITEKGLEVLSAIEQHVTEVDAMTHNLSMEELEHLNFLLDKLRG